MSLCELELRKNVYKFGLSNRKTLKLCINALRGYLKLSFEYELDIFPNTKVGAAKDHAENLHQGQTSSGPSAFALSSIASQDFQCALFTVEKFNALRS